METSRIGNSTPLPLSKVDNSDVSKAKQSFLDVLKSTVEETNAAAQKGNEAIQKLYTGEAKNLHEVMIATEQADISIRMLVQMRNKAMEAYNEIMRMQI